MKEQVILYRHSKEDISRIIQDIFRNHPDQSKEKALYVYSMDLLQNRLEHISEVFPKSTIHAIAIKTNALPEVLQHIVSEGHGLEAASIEEVRLAIQAGCPSERIVFDSPAKTREEIEECDTLYKGMYLNVNSFQELKRLETSKDLRIGLRVNPLLDVGAPGIYNVSNSNSKFGIPIHLQDQIIQSAFSMNHICGLHVHAGSEIGNTDQHVEAIGRVYDIAETINAKQKGKIEFFDLGGGIPARMKEGIQPTLFGFVDALKKRCPKLFSDYQLITEYGRLVHAHNAFAIGRVEYVLDYYNPQIIITHLGANLFLREIYSATAPYHAIHILDENGKLKSNPEELYDIGGPLCFSGDFIGRKIQLNQADENNWIVVSDCGANTISMWSEHCSREKIKVIYHQSKKGNG